MFRTAYQSGQKGVELLSAAGTGNKSARFCKFGQNVSRKYERELKGYTYSVSKPGVSSFIQLPASVKDSLGITQSRIVLHLWLSMDSELSVEFTILDKSGSRRRLLLTTTTPKFETNGLHAKIPLKQLDIPKEQWARVVFDLDFLAADCFGLNHTYESLDGISIRAVGKIHSIFSLPDAFPVAEDNTLRTAVPRTCLFPRELTRHICVVDASTMQWVSGAEEKENATVKPPVRATRRQVLDKDDSSEASLCLKTSASPPALAPPEDVFQFTSTFRETGDEQTDQVQLRSPERTSNPNHTHQGEPSRLAALTALMNLPDVRGLPRDDCSASNAWRDKCQQWFDELCLDVSMSGPSKKTAGLQLDNRVILQESLLHTRTILAYLEEDYMLSYGKRC